MHVMIFRNSYTNYFMVSGMVPSGNAARLRQCILRSRIVTKKPAIRLNDILDVLLVFTVLGQKYFYLKKKKQYHNTIHRLFSAHSFLLSRGM